MRTYLEARLRSDVGQFGLVNRSGQCFGCRPTWHMEMLWGLEDGGGGCGTPGLWLTVIG